MTGAKMILVMGPSGAGKSTLGAALAAALAAPFLDADDVCPPAARAKMTAGIPLGDADREPWLQRINREVHAMDVPRVVVACSAHKAMYRDWLYAGLAGRCIVYLRGTADVLRERMAARQNHFMPVALLPSQLALMEKPADCLELDVDRPVEELVRSAVAYVSSRGAT